MKFDQPIWKLMDECGRDLPSPFRFPDVAAWFDRNYPGVTEATLRTHLAGLTQGSRSRHPHFAEQEPIFRRVSRGLYEYLRPVEEAIAETTDAGSAVLFAISSDTRPPKSVRMARLRTFAESRREARRRGVQWFALSSHYGLIHDDDPSPDSLHMGSIPEEHSETWALWVSIRLEAALGSLRGARIHIDAPRQYSEVLRPVLVSEGAIVAVSARS